MFKHIFDINERFDFVGFNGIDLLCLLCFQVLFSFCIRTIS